MEKKHLLLRQGRKESSVASTQQMPKRGSGHPQMSRGMTTWFVHFVRTGALVPGLDETGTIPRCFCTCSEPSLFGVHTTLTWQGLGLVAHQNEVERPRALWQHHVASHHNAFRWGRTGPALPGRWRVASITEGHESHETGTLGATVMLLAGSGFCKPRCLSKGSHRSGVVRGKGVNKYQ